MPQEKPPYRGNIIYNQRTGSIFCNGDLLCSFPISYSGKAGYGLNNPACEDLPGVGPIPRGFWLIDKWGWHPTLGPCVAWLEPQGHLAHGRSAFRIHGDNRKMNHTASNGCIVAPREVREHLRRSGLRQLFVE